MTKMFNYIFLLSCFLVLASAQNDCEDKLNTISATCSKNSGMKLKDGRPHMNCEVYKKLDQCYRAETEKANCPMTDQMKGAVENYNKMCNENSCTKTMHRFSTECKIKDQLKPTAKNCDKLQDDVKCTSDFLNSNSVGVKNCVNDEFKPMNMTVEKYMEVCKDHCIKDCDSDSGKGSGSTIFVSGLIFFTAVFFNRLM